MSTLLNDYKNLVNELNDKRFNAFLDEKKEIDRLEKLLAVELLVKYENMLLKFVNSASLKTCDFAECNDINGVDFQKEYDVSIENIYPFCIIDKARGLFQDNYAAYIENGLCTVSSSEDAFYKDNILTINDSTYKVESEFHALILHEYEAEKRGICGGLYNLDYHDNPSEFKKIKIPSELKAFNNNDTRLFEARLCAIINMFDLMKEIENGQVNYFHDIDENIYELIMIQDQKLQVYENEVNEVEIIELGINYQEIENGTLKFYFEFDDTQEKLNISINILDIK